ncbi:DUF3800 domain-containing protein [Methylocaldum sp.]|uniref:DUF3800 domain-containing protein n=1 Tax=Methylocaldum sp. TaxID=1969727 RepID=UPI002D5B74DB|nr:DUF3800 domain-containing protein [Methylocaldum sp.]HYE38236.1 DUF3800 domain-containing protein [Methylocaldum sp.]
MAKPAAKFVYFFCDESSYVDDEFMAVAGLAIPDYELQAVTDELADIKKQLGGPSETKWNAVKSRRDSAHKAFVDHFHAGVTTGRFHFHIRFAPFDKYDHRLSGPKRRVDTTSKMHFQLLLHRALRFYGQRYKLRIRPDNGDCTAALVNQIDSLHQWGSHHHAAATDCIDSIEPRDSKRELLLQLLDVPLGAFTAIRNDRQLVGPKRELADYVAARFPDKNLKGNTPAKEMRFSIWNAIPSGAPKRGPWG